MMPPAVVHKVADVWKRFRAADLAEVPDPELLRRFVSSRDELAFEMLVRRHGPVVWSVCQRLLIQRQDAEDAFQTTFLVLARKAGSLSRRGLLANWLFGVARRAALALRRARGRRAVHECVYGEVPDVRPISPDLWTEVTSVLDEEIARLPGKYRMPLLLCCLDGMTHDQAAVTLDWPIGTVAGRLSRGRDLLRIRLRRRGIDLSASVLGMILAEDSFASVPLALYATSVTSGVTFAWAGGATASLSPSVAWSTQRLLRQMTYTRTISYFAALGILAAWGGLGFYGLQAILSADPIAQLSTTPREDDTTHIARRIASNTRTVLLPADPNAIILKAEITDSSREKPSTVVTVHTDGRVTAIVTQTSDGISQAVRLEDRLSPDDVQDLMQFVVHDQEFLDFDLTRVLSALQAEYEFDGVIPDQNNTSTTTLFARTADREHEVTLDKLGSAAVFFRESRRVRQLVAVDTRLRSLLNVLKAGGINNVNRMAEAVNRLLGPTFARQANFTAADLFSTAPLTNTAGTRYVFSRGYKYGGEHYFCVFLDVPDVGEPHISQVTPGPSHTAPALKRREGYTPRCFEEDLDD